MWDHDGRSTLPMYFVYNMHNFLALLSSEPYSGPCMSSCPPLDPTAPERKLSRTHIPPLASSPNAFSAPNAVACTAREAWKSPA